MKPRIHLMAFALPLVVSVLLAACSDEGDATGTTATTSTTPTTSTTAVTTTTVTSMTAVALTTTSSAAEIEAAPATGRILVSSTPITGHEGEALFIFGPNNESEICATIDSDPWTLTEAALTDRTADSDPCTGTLTDTVFEPGEYAVTASIFARGSRTPVNSTAALIQLTDGDVKLQLDGEKLSGATTGDPGGISVTVSEITGQAGKVLVVLGQNNAGSMCAMIDADSWELPTPTVLRQLPGGDSGPCGEDTPEVEFPAGETRIAVAVVIPGNPSPEVTIDLVVPVDGDVTIDIDGARLSA